MKKNNNPGLIVFIIIIGIFVLIYAPELLFFIIFFGFMLMPGKKDKKQKESLEKFFRDFDIGGLTIPNEQKKSNIKFENSIKKEDKLKDISKKKKQYKTNKYQTIEKNSFNSGKSIWDDYESVVDIMNKK